MKWLIVIGIGLLVVIGRIIYCFIRDLNKDNMDLQGITPAEKFKIIVDALNQHAYHGNGEIIPVDKRNFNLYEQGQNQIIQFEYSTGILAIIWKFKYFHKEVVHEKRYHDVRNLNALEQNKIAGEMIEEMSHVIEAHKKRVLTMPK